MNVAGIPIDPVTPIEALERLQVIVDCGASHVINHVPADPIVLARRNRELHGALQRAELNVPDGMGVVWALRSLNGDGTRERVYGPDFMQSVLSTERRLTHAFVGGSPPTLERLVSRISAGYPNAVITGAYAPPHREVSSDGVREDLDRLGKKADVLWVGLGTPKQQIWADLARKLAPARAIVTVGAAFDFLSGEKRQAPSWMQDAGLEWAYRLASEPRRLWRRYLVGNPQFVWRVARQRLDRGRRT